MRFTLPVAFATVVFVLTAGFLPIFDPDFFWHVKIGELIRQTGMLPNSEVFSHTAQGQPWVIQSWVSDVVLAYVWESAGIVGIRLLVAGSLTVIWLLTYQTVRLYMARMGTAVLLSGLAVLLIVPALAPRPTMMTALCLALTLYSLLAFRRSGELWWLLILPPLFVLWPNLHFGYIVGLGLIALFALSDLLARVIPIAHEHREAGTLIARGPALICLLCVAAIGANPYGYGVLWETVRMSLQGAASQVLEWRSPSFSDGTGKLFYGAISIFIIARSFARRSIHWLDIVVPLTFIGAALSAVRHIPLMGIVLMPFLARAFANWESDVFVVAKRAVTGLGSAAARDLGPRAVAIINLAFVACVVVVTVLLAPAADRHYGEKRVRLQPSGAADFLITHNLSGRLFNTYDGGGYLIYRLYPWQQVFIDGRYNPYPKQVIEDYFSITDGKPSWFATLQSYGIDIVLCENNSAFRQLMLSRIEFRLVYEDQHYSVLVRDIDRFRDLPTAESAMAPMRRNLGLSTPEFASEVGR